MNHFGCPASIVSTAGTLEGIVEGLMNLAPSTTDVDWRGPAAEAYVASVGAVRRGHRQLADELAVVVARLAGLAESVRTANLLASEWEHAVASAERRLAAAVGSGDTEAAARAGDHLEEIRTSARSWLARRAEAVDALDRETANSIDRALSCGMSLLQPVPAAGDAVTAAGKQFRTEVGGMVGGARAAMMERADQLSARIREFESVLAFLRMVGVRGVRIPWLEVLRTHRERLRGWGTSGRQFLSYSADDGSRVVEVFGDLEAAGHIAVLVPGISTSEYNYHERLQTAAAGLWGGDPSVAVVAWLGYDTPGSGPDGTGMLTLAAIDDRLARSGAAELALLVQWLAARRGDAHLSVIAHSYGSVVAGIAASEHGLAIDDLVLVGSPGVPVETAAELRLNPDGTVWAGLAPWDPIDELAKVAGSHEGAVHGTDPTSAGFGAVELELHGAFGHSGYFSAAGLAVLGGVVRSPDGRHRLACQSRRSSIVRVAGR